MNRKTALVVCALLASFSLSNVAQAANATDATPAPDPTPPAQQSPNANAPGLVNCGAAFPGAACGIIVGPVFSTSGKLVNSASIVGGVVRVSAVQTVNVSGFGEIHDFIWPLGPGLVGPFVAVGGVSNNGFSVAGGLMYGFKKSTVSNNNSPITVSLGFVYLPGAQKLGDGIEANKPLPNGETVVRYKTITSSGIMLAVGAHF